MLLTLQSTAEYSATSSPLLKGVATRETTCVTYNSMFLSLDAVSVMWTHVFSHVRDLVSDAQSIQSVPSHLADTLAAFTIAALDR